ncbi:uracil-DNA glycosylase family protein [Oceanobacillus alkalisoli]|uniref:uracil-DNA glycosylase family protein n=1 Tax=Oceanobacillus alkalisoli TaxID=2925113 RepID=UPI001EE41829|nr:uracil-DNA glycosylase family protein [Oceanobacillus alkalisoli]MCG5103202.1 uracil-DNA glycosylase family protein [Oceanobacillus alkalisoli]
MQPTIHHFLPLIETLPLDRPLTKQDLLKEQILIERDGDIEMYYAPHNEYINREAKVVIIGITPGWRQMKIAYEQFIKSFAADDKLETCLTETKKAAGFAASMRKNLIDMIDQCGIPSVLGIAHSTDLFSKNRYLLHTTSVIKYPVFFKGSNYTGHQPAINRSNLLHHYAFLDFPKELAQIREPALIIPLGKTVEQVVLKLKDEQQLSHHTYLTGFPHPSGANGHRVM